MSEKAEAWRLKQKVIADEIRAHIRAQRAIWQKIPYAAAMADGHGGGWSPGTEYLTGYYEFFGHASVAVDLENGELVWNRFNKGRADDYDVLRLLNEDEHFNARNILAQFESRAAQDPPSYFTVLKLKEDAAVRQRFVKENGLTPNRYKRQNRAA